MRAPTTTMLFHLNQGRIDRRPRPLLRDLPRLNSPWQDTDSGRYFGWWCRQANLRGDEAFVVEYIVCPHCRIGWVDRPYTDERYQRHGLAAAGFRALRAEHPQVTAWYAASSHMPDSKAFWTAVGDGVAVGYSSQELCVHVAHQGGLFAELAGRTARSTGRESSGVNVDLDRDLRLLRGQAATHVVRWPSREPIWTAVYNLTRGRIDRRPRYTTGQLPTLNSGH